ncbi:MAG: hypothetical protein Q7U75_18740, partial [Desulfobacterales bacterium]|nr:hypothetical protein [Desulfobacterales bacterium]
MALLNISPTPLALPAPGRGHLLVRLLRRPSAIAGATLLLEIISMAVLAPVLFPADPLDMVGQPFVWPG